MLFEPKRLSDEEWSAELLDQVIGRLDELPWLKGQLTRERMAEVVEALSGDRDVYDAFQQCFIFIPHNPVEFSETDEFLTAQAYYASQQGIDVDSEKARHWGDRGLHNVKAIGIDFGDDFDSRFYVLNWNPKLRQHVVTCELSEQQFDWITREN